MYKKILAILLMFYAAVAMAAVDVNKATEKDLDAVKGIGPVTTKLIISERKKGDFKSWQDLIDRVKGIGDARAAKLSADGLTVNGESYRAMSATPKAAKAAPAKPAASAKASASAKK